MVGHCGPNANRSMMALVEFIAFYNGGGGRIVPVAQRCLGVELS